MARISVVPLRPQPPMMTGDTADVNEVDHHPHLTRPSDSPLTKRDILRLFTSASLYPKRPATFLPPNPGVGRSFRFVAAPRESSETTLGRRES
jgi:hypothetical protein